MEKSPPWEVNRFSASQEILSILRKRKVHYGINKCLPPVPILSQIDAVHAPHSTPSRSILILSSHLRMGLQSGSFPSGPPKPYIRGLSRKFPNISRKNFPVLPWSYSALSPSKYSPLLCMHHCQPFFNVLKHSWKAVLGMLCKCASEFALIASTDSKRRPFSVDLSFGNRKKSAGAEAVEGQSSHVWPRSHGQGTMNVRARCHVGASIDSPAAHQVFFSWLPHEDVA